MRAVCHTVCVCVLCATPCVRHPMCHVCTVLHPVCHPVCVCAMWTPCVCDECHPACVLCATPCVCVPCGHRVCAVYHPVCVPCATPCVCAVCHPMCVCCVPPRVCTMCHPMCVCAVCHPVCVRRVHSVCHPGPRSATCTEHVAHTRIHASDTGGHRKAWTPSGSPPPPRAQDLRSLHPRERVFGLPRPSTLPGAEHALSLCAQRISIWPLGAAKPARRKSQESS